MSLESKIAEAFAAVGVDIKSIRESDFDSSKSDKDASYTYRAYHNSTTNTWASVRRSLATAAPAGFVVGSGVIPVDIKSLSYG